MYEKISWLASYPKSGNTWVRMFLNAYMSHFPLNINSAYQFASLDNDPALLQMLSPLSLDKMNSSESFLYRPAMLLNMLKMSRTKRKCLKTHNAKVCADGIPLIPLCLSDTALYIIRDPRDVCISLSKHLDVSIDETIEFMNSSKQSIVSDQNIFDVLTSWSNHVRTWTVDNKDLSCLVIKYEELINNPRDTFIKILRHYQIQLNGHEDRIDFALKESNFKQLKKYENEGDFIEKGKNKQFFRVGKMGQWATQLTGNQIDKITNDHGEMMEKFNYGQSIFSS